jgi:5-methylcytosine-specific restriction protein A
MPSAPPKHIPPGQKSTQQRMKEFDKQRGSTTARGYDEPWKRLRIAFLKRHPRCVECGAPANEVDHVKSVRDFPLLRLAWKNLQALCKPCHSRKTATTQGFANPERRYY